MRFGSDIKGVIFDIDGVLLDSMSIWLDLGVRYLLSIGKLPEEGLSKTLFSMSMEQGAEYLKENYAIEESTEEIGEDLQKMLRDFYFEEVRAKNGAEEMLKRLSQEKIRIMAATSSPRELVERALGRNGLLSYIERIFTSSEVGSSKHSPEIYDAACACMELERAEVCVIEDSLYALKTAQEAGYYTVGMYDEKGESDQAGLREMAGLYIQDLGELLKYI
ncbi:MAG: HAD family phosphatase [Lachnospiraceae bacterium]|nr:HAD family phosphatase [Lachnospiraceae bacterium]